LTTHCGSLPRPHDLLDMMRAKTAGQAIDQRALDQRIGSAVAESVRQQVEHGVDVVTDGEQSKLGFFSYISDRLEGFEPRSGPVDIFEAELRDFPEYYEDYFARSGAGRTVAPMTPIVCRAAVRYRGQEAILRDIDNLKAALADQPAAQAFMPSVAPSGVGANDYYASEEEYLFAAAEALHENIRRSWTLASCSRLTTRSYRHLQLFHTRLRGAPQASRTGR